MSAASPPTTPERNGFYVRGWVLAVVGVVVVAAAAIAVGVAVNDGGHGERRGFGRGIGEFGDHHGGGSHPVIRLVILLILVALAITGVVLLVRRSRAKVADATTSAEAILSERFARGEIDEADFVSRRDVLRGSS
jgi:putative membrane protein